MLRSGSRAQGNSGGSRFAVGGGRSAFKSWKSGDESIKHTIPNRPGKNEERVGHNYSSVTYIKWLNGVQSALPEAISYSLQSDKYIISMSGNLIINNPSADPSQLNGVNSLAMGCSGDRDLVCATCSIQNCSGHYGRIDLSLPVINVALIKVTANIVQCTCWNCGMIPVSPLTYETNFGRQAGNTTSRLKDACSKWLSKCVNCGLECNNIKVSMVDSEKFGQIVYTRLPPPALGVKKAANEAAAKVKYVMDIKRVKSLLNVAWEARNHNEARSKSCLKVFNIKSNPNLFIRSKILVTPPNFRPSIKMDNAVVEDPLTKAYQDIITTNNDLSSARSGVGGNTSRTRGNGGPKETPQDRYNKMVAVLRRTTLGNSQSVKTIKSKGAQKLPVLLKHLSRHPYDGKEPENAENSDAVNPPEHTTLVISVKPGEQRNASVNGALSGKKGKFHNDLNSKRTTGARAVLSIDPTLRFGEIGLPRSMSYKFNRRIVVTPVNLQAIQYLTKPDLPHYPNGYITKIKKKGQFNFLNYNSSTIIEVGDEVKRYIMEGDLCVFNRFPIIWKHSINTHTVVFHDETTIRLHPSSLEGYHADFDGDTGLVRFPESDEAVDAALLMHARYNLVNGGNSSSVAGLTMDTAMGAYLMTLNEDEIEEHLFREHVEAVFGTDQANNIIEDIVRRVDYINTYVVPDGVDKIKEFSTRTLISTCFPPNLTLIEKEKDKLDESQDNVVIIISGIFVSGALTSKYSTNGRYSLSRAIQDQAGDEAASDFLTYATWLTVRWLKFRGLTIGLDDVKIDDPDYQEGVRKIIKETQEDYYTYFQEQLERDPSAKSADIAKKASRVIDAGQGRQAQFLSQFLLDYAKKHPSSDLPMIDFIRSGRFSAEIVAQMTGSVGMMNFFGEACPESYGGTITGEEVCQSGYRTIPYGKRRGERELIDPLDLGWVRHSYGEGMDASEYFHGGRAALTGVITTNCGVAAHGHLFNLLNWLLLYCKYYNGYVIQVFANNTRKIIVFSHNYGLNTEASVAISNGSQTYYSPTNLVSLFHGLYYRSLSEEG
jgi:DNA-directed RNA polymerase beta' subunit